MPEEYYDQVAGPHGRQKSYAGGYDKDGNPRPAYWDEQERERNGGKPTAGTPIVPGHYFGPEYAGGSVVTAEQPAVPTVDPFVVVSDEELAVTPDEVVTENGQEQDVNGAEDQSETKNETPSVLAGLISN